MQGGLGCWENRGNISEKAELKSEGLAGFE